MALTMFDSVDVDQIPRDAVAVAGYTSGKWPTFPSLVAGWPNAKRLSIAVTARRDAECLDVEAGDARPDQAAAWVRRQQTRGVARPVLYTSVSVAQGLLDLLAEDGILRESVRLWTAHYTHVEHLCGPQCHDVHGRPYLRMPADATQWTDKALERNLDQSICTDDFFAGGGVLVAPDHQPVALLPFVSDCACPTGGAWVLAVDGSVYAFGGAPYLGSPAEDKHGENWKAGHRQPAHIEARRNGYTITDTQGEKFSYGPSRRRHA